MENETEQLTPRFPGLLANPQQDAFILALLEHGKIAPAAAAVGISYATARRWLAAGPVREAYAEARREMMRHALAKLAAAIVTAVDTLTDCMRDDIAPAIRVQAAQALLSAALKAQDTLELDSRLAALESRPAD